VLRNMEKNKINTHVAVIMGSQSDWPTMKEATVLLTELKINFETKIISAHRTPDRLFKYGAMAFERGLKVIIAGAGGAAHLPGMVASKTIIPVIGVPVRTNALSGLDSLYSIVQMPRGYPVATMAIGSAGAANAALMAASILALENETLRKILIDWKLTLTQSVPDEPERK
jgi:5-(carboxyamino)imidazole ribonucleotide mutase